MATTQEYVSPDGSLRFQVVTSDSGEISLGFVGFAWHTHADVLAAVAGEPQAEAVKRFVHDLLASRAVIAVSRVTGEIRDIWVTDDPVRESQYLSEGEEVELRYWDGRRWTNPGQISVPYG
jgi:hypothetical protein